MCFVVPLMINIEVRHGRAKGAKMVTHHVDIRNGKKKLLKDLYLHLYKCILKCMRYTLPRKMSRKGISQLEDVRIITRYTAF